jgi:hypothetical protein
MMHKMQRDAFFIFGKWLSVDRCGKHLKTYSRSIISFEKGLKKCKIKS